MFMLFNSFPYTNVFFKDMHSDSSSSYVCFIIIIIIIIITFAIIIMHNIFFLYAQASLEMSGTSRLYFSALFTCVHDIYIKSNNNDNAKLRVKNELLFPFLLV